MPTETETPPGPPATDHILAAALRPAEASAARDGLTAALEAAAEAGTALALELDADADTAWPCCLQLLVAAERSAAARGVSVRLGPRASAARSGLTTSPSTEHETP